MGRGHPSSTEVVILNTLLSQVEASLPRQAGTAKRRLHSLVTSDLGAPLPLHISLSCPLTLTTEQRDSFLEQLTHTIAKASKVRHCDCDAASLCY